MKLRDWVHPGWFRLADWWRAERARQAQAEAAWQADDDRLMAGSHHPGEVLVVRHPVRAFGFTQLHRGPAADDGNFWPVGWDEIDDEFGSLARKVRPGSILRRFNDGELMRVDSIAGGVIKVTRGYGSKAMTLPPDKIHWSSVEPVQYVEGIGVVGKARH